MDPSEELRYHRRERVNGKFSRSIQLAFPVETEQGQRELSRTAS